MIPFKTTAQQRVELFGIATAMSGAGLPDEFVANAVELANVYEGTFELMKFWMMTESAPEAPRGNRCPYPRSDRRRN